MADWLEFLLFYCKSPIEETRELPRSKEAQVLTLTPGSCLLAMDPRDSLPGPRGPLSASPMVQGLTLIFFKTDTSQFLGLSQGWCPATGASFSFLTEGQQIQERIHLSSTTQWPVLLRVFTCVEPPPDPDPEHAPRDSQPEGKCSLPASRPRPNSPSLETFPGNPGPARLPALASCNIFLASGTWSSLLLSGPDPLPSDAVCANYTVSFSSRLRTLRYEPQ